jgi:hypothetical protein
MRPIQAGFGAVRAFGTVDMGILWGATSLGFNAAAGCPVFQTMVWRLKTDHVMYKSIETK